jgi:hypothetical protein
MRSEIRYAICGFVVFAAHTMWSATAFSAPRHTHQKYLFGQAQSSVAPQPESFATGDFNGDGRRDFAVVNPATNTVSIILGNADGTFSPRVDYATGSNPVMVVTGDFNGDGKTDLAIGRRINARGNGGVAIMLGNGDGTFQAAVDYPLANFQISGLTTGDFNGDGKLDLVAITYCQSCSGTAAKQVSVLLGNGDGTLQTPAQYSTGSGANSVVSGDFDGDGKLDLAVTFSGDAASSGGVSVLLGNGDGTFRTNVDYMLGGFIFPSSIVAAGVNTGGKLNLAVSAPNATWILHGSGDGTFAAPVVIGTGGSFLKTEEWSGDGKADIAIVDGGIAFLLGKGDGRFQIPISHSAESDPSAAAVGDFTGNRTSDVVTGNTNDNTTGNTGSVLLEAFPVSQLHASSSAKVIVLSNPTPAPLEPLGIKITGDFSETNNCGARLAAGAQCEIAITFSPTATGTRLGTLTLLDSAGTGTQNVALRGEATAQGPIVMLAPTSLTFVGVRVATVSSQTVHLQNSGDGPLTISSVATTGQFSATNTCGASVAAGGSCIFTVTFAPSFPETQTGSLIITDNAPGSPRAVSLTGTGESLAFSKTSLNFSPVVVGKTSATPQTVTLFNVGPGVVTLTGIVLTGSNAGDFQVIPNGPMTPNCAVPGTLRAQSHCFISVTFTPTGSGPRTAQMSVSDDRDPLPLTLPISGVGKPVGPIATLSAASLSFGVVPAGSKKNADLQLTNTGDQPLSILAISTLAEYSATNICGPSVAAGASCTLTVTFAPTFGGTQTGSLTITDNAPGSPQMVSLTGIGENIEFTKTSLVFATVAVGQTSAPQTVSLFSLSGNALVDGILTGPNATDFQLASSSCGALEGTVEIRRGDPCKMVLIFTPTAKGPRSAQLIFTNNSGSVGAPPAVLPLSGEGADNVELLE